MKIASVTTQPVELTLTSPMELVAGSTGSVTNVLVTVTTDSGVRGFGEATPRPKLNGESVASVMSVIGDHFAPVLGAHEIDGLAQVSRQLATFPGNGAAKAGVEVAVLDAFAKTVGTSCHTLLGGFTDSLPAAALLPLKPAEALIDLAASYQETLGVSVFKLKVGRNLDRDLAVVGALRSAYPTHDFYADANGSYTPADAARFLACAVEHRLSMVEELIGAEHLSARARLTASSYLPVLGDETCADKRSALRELSSGAVSGVSLKVGRTGLSASTQIRSAAETWGLPVVMGYEHVSSLGAAASLAFAAGMPSTSAGATEVLSFLELERDLTTEPLEVSEGRVRLPSGPGLGIEIDAEYWARDR